jgi:hypothetical protein
MKHVFVVALGVACLACGPVTAQELPVHVWIDRLQHYPAYADRPGVPLPEELLSGVRQGFLDWARIVLSLSEASARTLVILHRSAEERQGKLLAGVGLFRFVERPEEADLTVEVLRRTSAGGEATDETVVGRYTRPRGSGQGRIQLVLEREGSVDEFALRTALMHEVGHALGLSHTPDEQCNLMALQRTTCQTPVPTECNQGAAETRCIAVDAPALVHLRRALSRSPLRSGS